MASKSYEDWTLLVTHKKFSYPKNSLSNSNLKCTFHFFLLGENGNPKLKGGPKGGSQSCKTPRNPLIVVLFVGKNIYLGRMSEEAKFPNMVYTREFMQLHELVMILQADSALRCQAYPSGMPNVTFEMW